MQMIADIEDNIYKGFISTQRNFKHLQHVGLH